MSNTEFIQKHFANCVSKADIIKHKKDLAKQWHPDNHGNSYNSEMQQLNLITIDEILKIILLPRSVLNLSEGSHGVHVKGFKSSIPVSFDNNIFEIPEGVNVINDDAFFNPYNAKPITMSTIIFPSTLKCIGYRAFKGWDSVKILDFSRVRTTKDSPLQIYPDSFSYNGSRNCTSWLQEVIYPKHTLFLGANNRKTYKSPFARVEYFEDITELELTPDNFQFNHPTNLQFNHPMRLSTVYPYLQKITLSGFTEIPSYYFKDCAELITISGLESVQRINKAAFVNCPKLHNLDIPANTYVDPEAFINCSYQYFNQ